MKADKLVYVTGEVRTVLKNMRHEKDGEYERINDVIERLITSHKEYIELLRDQVQVHEIGT